MRLLSFITSLLMALLLASEVLSTPIISSSTSSLNPVTGPYDGLPFPMDAQEYSTPVHEYTPEETETWFNATMAEHGAGLEKRGKGKIYCLPDPALRVWQMAYLPSVQTVIRHLMDGGPRRCHWKARWCRRAACLNGAELVLCNYNWSELVTNCDYPATYAIDMITICNGWIDIRNPQKSYVGGHLSPDSLHSKQTPNISFTMTLLTALLLVVCLTIEVLSTTTSHLGGPYNGLPFPTESMKFNLTIDGTAFQGHGTIQQVYAQYATSHPSFKLPENLSPGATFALKAENDRVQGKVEGEVEKRGKSSVFCLPNPQVQWVMAPEGGVWQNINFLRGVQPDLCRFAARSCRKLACANTDDIGCLQNESTLWRACSYMGSYAEDIINHCPQYRSVGYVGGQEDDTDGYSVIVRGDPC
ncbi:hypothetical protein DL98DRAFT_566624 [Cadophora sp. DSE1049]|nr:hypothetical protein DL98DRAFT_566624 [Cadophora sp. DSE1049]